LGQTDCREWKVDKYKKGVRTKNGNDNKRNWSHNTDTGYSELGYSGASLLQKLLMISGKIIYSYITRLS